MKPYCTQNNGDCTTCSLVNYNRDCKNNPVERLVKKNISVTEAQAETLRRLAYETRESEAEHVRRALNEYLKDK